MSKFQVKRISSDHRILWPKESMPSATFLSSEIYGHASSHNIQTRISWGSSCQWEPCWVASWYSPLRSHSSVKWELITQRIGNFQVDIFPPPRPLHPQWKVAEATTILSLYSCGWILGSTVVVHCELRCGCCLVAQSCPTLCDPMDCGPPGSSLHGISQARILEWVRGVREKETTGVSVKLVAFGSSSRYI